jgi:non-homologous end joining protein Ku
MRKLIAFDDDTLAKLTELAKNRMGTLQELADEAFADLLAKHGVPRDLKDALKKSVKATASAPREEAPPQPAASQRRARRKPGRR